MKKIILFGVLIFLILAVMSGNEKNGGTVYPDNPSNPGESSDKDYKEVTNRLSSTVSFIHSGSAIETWLNDPTEAFIEAWVYFEGDLNDSTIFGIDMELLEGTTDPIRFEGADWMALVGIQRNGTVWVAGGEANALSGNPSKERNWQLKSLSTELKPNTWYKLKTVADFNELEFVSFTVSGPNINETLDLTGIQVDYPNYAPFDQRALTHYVWTIDGTSIGGTKDKSSSVYFDDIRYGIINNGQETTLHTDNLESTPRSFNELPVTLENNSIPLSNFSEKVWYQEREEALTRPIEKSFARSGDTVIEADAEVRDIERGEWEAE